VILAAGSQRRARAAALGPQAVPPITTMWFSFDITFPRVIFNSKSINHYIFKDEISASHSLIVILISYYPTAVSPFLTDKEKHFN
jgi:hypothetical protein